MVRFVGMLLEPVLKVFDIRAVFVDVLWNGCPA